MNSPAEQQVLRLEQLMGDASFSKGTSESYANCSPALREKEKFKADSFSFWGTPAAPTAVLAKENFAQGSALGVYFRVNVDEGQLRGFSPYALVDQVLYHGRGLEVDELNWAPGQSLSFRFKFDFTYLGVDYQFSQGFFSLNF